MLEYYACIISNIPHDKPFFFFFSKSLSKIMQALVEHYSGKGWLLRVEQCVLHMDISSLDFNQVYNYHIFAKIC